MYPAIVASAYFGSNQHEQALLAAQEAIQIDEKNTDPYLYQAASLVELGRLEEAITVATAVLKLKPDFRLDAFATTQPFVNPEDLNHLISNLKSAGLA